MATGKRFDELGLRHARVFLLSIVFLMLSVSLLSAAVNWSTFRVFNDGRPTGMPYASNGPGCWFGGSQPSQGATPGTNCPSSNKVYDLGAVWVDQDSNYVAFMIVAPNLSDGAWCGGAIGWPPFPSGVRIGIEFDVDNSGFALNTTGCNNSAGEMCYPGSDFQIWYYGNNQTAFTWYNKSACGLNCFTTNGSVIVEKNISCSSPSIVMLAVNRSALVGLTGMNFETNSFADMGPVENLGGYGFDKMMMAGEADMMFASGPMCAQWDRTNETACINNSNNYSCRWDSTMQICDMDFSGMTCSQFCGACNSTANCQSGGMGKCASVPAPPTIPQGAVTWNDGGTKMCVEDMGAFQFGGFGNCDNDCRFCVANSTCTNSRVPNPMGTGAGCQWVTDPFDGRQWCDTGMFDISRLTCGPTSAERCFNQSACQGIGLTWSGAVIGGNGTNCTYVGGSNTTSGCSISLCYTPGQEICFDGRDNNGDNMVDCADAFCSREPFCGGDIDVLSNSYLVEKGGATLSGTEAMRFSMFQNMDPSPPVMLYGIAENNSLPSHIDIIGFDVKDMGKAIGFGIRARNLSSLECGGNGTGKYFYLLDSDSNSTSGCTANISGTNYTGFEYRLEYEVQNISGNFTEIRRGFRCISNTTGFALQPLKLAGAPPMPNFGQGEQRASCVFGVAIMAVDKVDIGNPTTSPIRIMAATADNETSLERANKSIRGPDNGGMYYTPGTIDFKPSDCFANPAACGTAFSVIGGGKFMPFEDCMPGTGDEDLDSSSNCDDADCSMVPWCAGQYDPSTDKTAPTVFSTSADTFRDFVFLHWTTNEPTNGSIAIYNTCSNSTAANTIWDDPPFVFDKFKPWHDIPIRNNTLDHDGATITLAQNTTYYYKLTTCDRGNNCAVSGCLNFTTKTASESQAFQFKFDFSPPPLPLINTTVLQFWNGTGYQNITAGQAMSQSSYLTNSTLKFDNEDNGWSIEMNGIDLAKALSMNISEAMNVTNESGDVHVGMDQNKWLEIAQNLGPENITITIPEGGDVLIKCATDNLSNCQDVTDNATLMAGGDGFDFTNWTIPTGLGFSVYGVNSTTDAIRINSDRDVYRCYPNNCTAYFNLTVTNETLINASLWNISVVNNASASAVANFSAYIWNTSTLAWDIGTGVNRTNFTTPVVNISGTTQFKVVVNVSDVGFGIWDFTVLLNGSGVNITDRQYIDTVNLTSPANNTVNRANGTFRFVLLSANDSSQPCVLYINGTASGNATALNDTVTNITSNWSTSGTYNWTVGCTTDGADTGNSTIRTVIVDAPPTITLTAPANASITNTTPVSFNYTASDDFSANVSCNLTIDGVVANSTANTTNGNLTNMTASVADGSTHAWFIICNDSLNIGASSVYNLTVDTHAPNWTGNATSFTSPVTYSSSATYGFNITWFDALVGINSSWLVFNTTSYSMDGSGSVYNVTLPAQPAGNYTYQFFANDSAGNLNSSDVYTLNITPVTSTCTINATNSSVTYPDNVTVTASCTNAEASASLFRNGTDVTAQNGVSTRVAAGTQYNYTVNVSETQNYSSANNTVYVNVSMGTPTLSVNSSAGWTIGYLTPTNLTGSGCPTIGVADAVCNITINATNYSTSFTINRTLAAGTYNVTLNTSGGANWTQTESTSQILNITQSDPALNLSVNGSIYNMTIVNGSATNVTGTKGYTEGNMSLWRNGTHISNTSDLNITTGLVTLNPGSFNYTLNYSETENFSATSKQLTVTVMVITLQANETLANNATINITNTTTMSEIVVTNGTPLTEVTIPPSVSENTTIALDLSLMNASTTASVTNVTIANDLTLERTTNETSGTINVTVTIPAGTNISGTDWSGVLVAPTAVETSTVTVSPDTGYTATTQKTIEIGFPDVVLTFDAGVRILIEGQAGKSAGYYTSGSFTKISATCAADSQATGDALAAGGDCKIDSGSDLVIWTKHFTTFVTYTQTAIPQTGGGPTGAGGGGGAARTFVGVIKAGEENVTTENVTAPAANVTPAKAPVAASLKVPESASVGSTVTLTALTADGTPAPNAIIEVIMPNQNKFSVVTDAEGKADLFIDTEGAYTFAIPAAGVQAAGTLQAKKEAPKPPTPSPPVAPPANQTVTPAQPPAGGVIDWLLAAGAIGAVVIVVVLVGLAAAVYYFFGRGKRKGL